MASAITTPPPVVSMYRLVFLIATSRVYVPAGLTYHRVYVPIASVYHNVAASRVYVPTGLSYDQPCPCAGWIPAGDQPIEGGRYTKYPQYKGNKHSEPYDTRLNLSIARALRLSTYAFLFRYFKAKQLRRLWQYPGKLISR